LNLLEEMRSFISYRRQSSSRILWHEGWIVGEADESDSLARVFNNNVHVVGDVGLSKNMLKLHESSTKQVLLRNESLGSNLTPSFGVVYRHEGAKEVSLINECMKLLGEVQI